MVHLRHTNALLATAWRWLAGGCAALTLTLTAQAQPSGCMPPKAVDAPAYASPRLPDAEAVVVYLHGLHGDVRETWIAGSGASSVAWPCLALTDQEVFGPVNAYMASYRSKAGRSNPSIEEAATLIAKDMRTDGVFKHAQVSVVAHSMGGIVLAHLLTRPGLLTADEKARVRLVVFAGTPAEPTEAAAICGKFGVNAQCQEMSDATRMSKLWAAWDNLRNRPAAWCVAEGSDMFMLSWRVLVRIVPEKSAHRPCAVPGQRTVADGLDHSDVAKPPSVGERPHRDLRNAFAACVRPHLSTTAVSFTETADERRLSEAASRWFYRLVDTLTPSADWTLELRQSLASESDVGRYWNLVGTNPSLDFEQYEPLSAPVFTQALRQALPDLLPRLAFQRARPVAKVGQLVSDSKLKVLAQRLQSAAALRDSDWAVALKPTAELEGQYLLLLRPGSSNKPGAAAAGDFGLLGVLFLPKPVDHCATG